VTSLTQPSFRAKPSYARPDVKMGKVPQIWRVLMTLGGARASPPVQARRRGERPLRVDTVEKLTRKKIHATLNQD